VARHGDVDCFNQRKARRERQCLRRWVVRAELDERAAGEIARRRDPSASLPAPARILVQRDQPIALDRAVIGNEVRVGRAGALDDPDAAQNRLPAARSVNAVSGPISK
jgi:hypothetical protein